MKLNSNIRHVRLYIDSNCPVFTSKSKMLKLSFHFLFRYQFNQEQKKQSMISLRREITGNRGTKEEQEIGHSQKLQIYDSSCNAYKIFNKLY